MIIEYCHECGLRIREADIQSGAATRGGEDRIYCPACRPARKRSGSMGAASRETAPLPRDAAKLRESRTVSRPTRPSGGTAIPTSERRQAPASRKPGIPPQLLIGGGVALILLPILAALLFGNNKPTTPKTGRAKPADTNLPPTTPVLPGKALPEPDPDPVPKVSPPTTPPAEKKGVADIREGYARGQWEELKKKAERDPAAQWSTLSAIQDFINGYRSTEAGKEAAAYLEAHAKDGPPPPTPDRVIAGLKADYAQEQPKTGWQYLWNADGEIGRSANYKPLVWNAKERVYAGNAKTYPHRGTAHHYARLNEEAGHPGAGANQKESGGVDRFVIAAYTLQPDQAARIAIRGRVSCGHGAGGVELRLYVNDELKGASKVPGGKAPLQFSTWLGELKEGDTIYVAIGPDRTDGNDSFNLSFRIYK